MIDEIPPLGLGNIPLRSPNPKKIPSENACIGVRSDIQKSNNKMELVIMKPFVGRREVAW
jgi:hypothetical protein